MAISNRGQSRNRWLEGTAMALACGGILLTPTPAHADCSDTAPDSGDTVTCDGGPPNPFTTGIINSQAEDVTLNVLTGAEIVVDGRAVFLGDRAFVTNDGSIITDQTGPFDRDVALRIGAGSTLINNGEIRSSGGTAASINRDSTAINDGLIRGVRGLGAGAGSDVTNRGTIRGTDDTALGFGAVTVGATSFFNSETGLVTSPGTGIDASVAVGGSLRIENYGMISGQGYSPTRDDATAMFIEAFGDVTIINAGLIAGLRLNSNIPKPTIRIEGGPSQVLIDLTETGRITNGGGTVISVSTREQDSEVFEFRIAGIIESDDQDTGRGISLIPHADSTVTIDILPTGQITTADAAIIGSQLQGTSTYTVNVQEGGLIRSRFDAAIQEFVFGGGEGLDETDPFFADSLFDVTIAGTVERTTAGDAISLKPGPDTVRLLDTGLVIGDISLGRGDDLFELVGGGNVMGAVDGGDGTDIFALSGDAGEAATLDASTLNLTDFEVFEKRGGGLWRLIGGFGGGLPSNGVVRGGVLQVDGQYAALDLEIRAGGALGGTGTVGSVNLTGGTLSPGADTNAPVRGVAPLAVRVAPAASSTGNGSPLAAVPASAVAPTATASGAALRLSIRADSGRGAMIAEESPHGGFAGLIVENEPHAAGPDFAEEAPQTRLELVEDIAFAITSPDFAENIPLAIGPDFAENTPFAGGIGTLTINGDLSMDA
ncbi:MAG: hypothetical protein ACSHW2_08285, partial [Parasphingopyxis sp.]